MAAITSTTGGGNWSAGGSWVGGVKPATGDTVTIDGPITLDEAATIGTGAGTALTVNSTKTLTIGAFTLTLNGSVSLPGAVVQNAGSTVTFNGNFNMVFGAGDAGSWVCNGTSGSKCTLQAAATFGWALRATGTGVAVTFKPTHTNITRWGRSDSTDEHATTIYSHTKTSAFELTNCKIDSYWRFRFAIGYTPNADSTWKFVNCDFRNPLHTSLIEYTCIAAHNAGTRTISKCTFVGTSANRLINITPDGADWGNTFVIDDCVGEDVTWYNGAGAPVVWDVATRYVNYTGADLDVFNTRGGHGGWRVHDCAINATRANAHIISASGSGGTNVGIIEDNITFGANSDDNHYLYNGTTTIRRNISVGGQGVGTTAAGTTAVTIERHTHIHKTGNFDSLGLFESAVYGSNLVTFRSCLEYGIADATERGIKAISGTVNLAYTDYNDFYNMSSANRYDAITVNALTEGVDTGFGAFDINANPNFNDVNATFATWDTSLGGAGTVANAFAELLKKNGFDRAGTAATFNAAYTKAALLTYLRNAFTPTNSALDGAGFGGEDIGAINVAPAATPVSNDFIIPYSAQAAINNSIVSNFDSGQALLSSFLVNYDALSPVSSLADLFYSALQRISSDISVSYESVSALPSSYVISYESIANLSKDSSSDYESQALIQGSLIIEYESIQGLLNLSAGDYESLSAVLADKIINYEALGVAETPVSNDMVIPYTARSIVLVSIVAEYSSEQKVSTDISSNHESMEAINISKDIGYEVLQAVITTASGSYESLSVISVDKIANYESLSGVVTTPVSNDFILSMESLGIILRSMVFDFSALSNIQVSSVLSFDVSAKIDASITAGYESTQSVVALGSLPYEVLQAIAAQANIQFESLLGSNVSVVVNFINKTAKFSIKLDRALMFKNKVEKTSTFH